MTVIVVAKTCVPPTFACSYELSELYHEPRYNITAFAAAGPRLVVYKGDVVILTFKILTSSRIRTIPLRQLYMKQFISHALYVATTSLL